MKTWIVARSGKPKDALELKPDWPTPASPKGGDILVKVSYAALNPLDLVVMGWPAILKKNPAVPAVDFAGEIVQVGPSVLSASPDLRVGTTVCGTLPTMQILRGYGTLAEYIVLPAHAVAEKPPNLDARDAAALMGVAGQTTAILMRVVEAAEGDRILVNGASGGVGCFVVQVLRAKGVHVTAICSRRNEAMVRRLGAEEVRPTLLGVIDSMIILLEASDMSPLSRSLTTRPTTLCMTTYLLGSEMNYSILLLIASGTKRFTIGVLGT